MRAARVGDGEMRAALRQQGVADVANVAALVLETDGSFSVVRRHGDDPSIPVLEDVRPDPPGREARPSTSE